MRRSRDRVVDKKRRSGNKNRSSSPEQASKHSRHVPAGATEVGVIRAQSRDVKKLLEGIGNPRAERLGILTGDRKDNTYAQLIVGTTEIYRNQLFDSLRGGSDVNADLVVLDEAHYLGDEDRGHVWEEAIILTPPRIRLLLLSATVGNADEFAAWIAEVRGVRCGVVTRPGARPVPLRAAMLLPDKRLIPLANESGKLNPEISRLLEENAKAPKSPRRRW
jgi:ATP-dependent RNA helicase HelY